MGPDSGDTRPHRAGFKFDAIRTLDGAGLVCGSLLLSLRLVAGWIYTQRLKSRFIRTGRSEWTVTASGAFGRQMQLMRPVQLVESLLISVPTAIGWLRRVILLPASALSGLSVSQLEAIPRARAGSYPPTRLSRQSLPGAHRNRYSSTIRQSGGFTQDS
jgi:hypothetical protein